MKRTLSAKERQFLYAANRGQTSKVLRLLRAGVRVDTRDPRGENPNRTALMHAAENGHFETVRELLRAGANANAKDAGFGPDCPGGNTAIILALQNGHIRIARCLLAAGANPQAAGGGTSVLNAAVRADDNELVKQLLEMGADPLRCDSNGFNAVSTALQNGKDHILRLLLKRGVDPNMVDMGGQPLLLIAATGQLAACKVLVRAGADPNCGDADGFTPLMMACRCAQVEIVRFLLSLGVKVNVAEKQWNRTALDIVNRLQAPPDLAPAVLHRIRSLGQGIGPPAIRLEIIKRMLIRAGAKPFDALGAQKKALPSKSLSRAQRSNRGSQNLGVFDFLDLVNDAKPAWALFAVKADLPRVTSAVADLYPGAGLIRNVAQRAGAAQDDVNSAQIPIVKLRRNPWTVVFIEIMQATLHGKRGAESNAATLSEKLDTRAIAFVGEDTVGAVNYRIFQSGNLIESAEWIEGNGFTSFQSKVRPKPDVETVDDVFLNSVFKNEGLYLPACYPTQSGQDFWLSVEPSSKRAISAVNFVRPR